MIKLFFYDQEEVRRETPTLGKRSVAGGGGAQVSFILLLVEEL